MAERRGVPRRAAGWYRAPVSIRHVASVTALALAPACAAGGARSPSGAPPPVVAVASTCAPSFAAPPDVLAEGFAAPPPLAEAVLAAEREKLRAEVASASFAAPPARRTTPADPRRITWTRAELVARAWEAEPDAPTAGRRVRAPGPGQPRVVGARLAPSGELELSLEATAPLTGVSARFGALLADVPFSPPRWQPASWPLREGGSSTLVLPLPELMAPDRDAAGLGARGRGVVAWRLEAFDPSVAELRILDGLTAFRCDSPPCAPGAAFTALPTVRLGPELDLVDDASATVTVVTDVPTMATVLVQPARGELMRFSAATPALRHEIELVGLAPDTRHRYQVLVVDRRGEVGESVSASFRTARGATDPRPVSFVVLGSAPLDSARVRAAEGSAARRAGAELVSRAVTADTDFLLAVGGLAAGPTTEPDVFVAELEDFARALFPHCAHVPCYEVLGDREVVVEAWEAGWALGQRGAESAEALFAGAVQNPRNGPRPEPGGPPLAEASYSFDRGPVHVAVLHTGYFWRSHPDRLDHPKAALGQRAGWVRDADLRWLDADLTAAAARGARHAFVVTAVPAFPNGGQVGQGMYWGGAVPEVLERRAELLRLLGAHRVRALIAAGEPSYSRTRVHPGLVPGLARPVWQIVTGGAATAPIARARDVPWANDVARFDLRPHHVTVVVAGDRVIVTATSRAGEPIDRFELAAPG